MARPTQYQKLSLQLDAENQKLKSKLEQTKAQMRGLRQQANDMRKGFGSSFDAMGGKAGMLKNQVTGLIGQISSLHPGVLALAGIAGMLGLAFKDLTSYTQTWEGALSDAGRKLASIQTGMSSFWKLASEQRGKALAEGGIFGWIGETIDQLQGLTTGMTQAAVATQVGVASIVNDAMLTWQQGLLKTTVGTTKLRAETQELYNQFRDKALIPEDRLKAVETYKKKALELYQIQKTNAENEIAYLQEQSKLSGNSYEDNLKIEQKKAEIYTLEKEYLRLVGRSIEYENSITKELEAQSRLKKEINFEELKSKKPIADKKSFKEEAQERQEAIDIRVAQEQKLANDILAINAKLAEDSKTLSDRLAEASKTSFEIAMENAKSWANGIAEATARSGAGINDFINEIRRAAKETISVYLSQAVAAMVTGAIRDTSLASGPFGFLVAPIAAAGAAALANSAFDALIPSFAVGTDYVPRDMLAQIHKGERIIPASQNKPQQLVAEVRGSDLYFVLTEYDRKRGNTL